MTLLCPFSPLGTSGPPFAPAREPRALAAALPLASLSALFLFTGTQQPRGPPGTPGPGGHRTSPVSPCASGCLDQHLSGRKGAWLSRSLPATEKPSAKESWDLFGPRIRSKVLSRARTAAKARKHPFLRRQVHGSLLRAFPRRLTRSCRAAFSPLFALARPPGFAD